MWGCQQQTVPSRFYTQGPNWISQELSLSVVGALPREIPRPSRDPFLWVELVNEDRLTCTSAESYSRGALPYLTNLKYYLPE
jgi:hypothetical protein